MLSIVGWNIMLPLLYRLFRRKKLDIFRKLYQLMLTRSRQINDFQPWKLHVLNMAITADCPRDDFSIFVYREAFCKRAVQWTAVQGSELQRSCSGNLQQAAACGIINECAWCISIYIAAWCKRAMGICNSQQVEALFYRLESIFATNVIGASLH